MPETSQKDPQEPIVELRDVHKSFGDLTVLDGVDLAVRPGERVGIIGTSGSGKSTILRIVQGLEPVDRGTVRVDGRAGMVFQHFHLFPHMTALGNVTAAPIHVLGQSRSQARERGLDLLGLVGLRDRADAYPAMLSGGQKQRVAIARALATDPEVMLFDEVTSALDPEVVGEVLEVVRELSRGDMTILVVTHQMNFAAEISDRVLFLDAGRIVEEGPPAQVLEDPEEPRTREFLRRVLDAT